MIEGVEWLFLGAFGVVSLIGFYMVVSVQGDLNVKIEEGVIDITQEAVFSIIRIIEAARNNITIYDDGTNYGEKSVYNNSDVLNAIRKQIDKYPDLQIRICFDRYNEGLRIMDLLNEFDSNISISYSLMKNVPYIFDVESHGALGSLHLGAKEAEFCNIYYKVVDNGRRVYFTKFGRTRDLDNIHYHMRYADKWYHWATHKRVGRLWLKNFKQRQTGFSNAFEFDF